MTRYAGQAIRDTRVARSTGVLVQVCDTDHPESPVARDGDAPRWATMCAEHGTYCSHDTWRTARSFMAAPEEWCEDCRAVLDANGGEPVIDAAGFTEEERERGLQKRRAKAAVRAEAQAAEKSAQRRRRSLEAQWSEFALGVPVIPREFTAEERARLTTLRVLILERTAGARKAHDLRERAEAELYGKPPPKPKREKELEAQIAELDARVDELRRGAEEARRERDYVCRRAFLRNAAEAGWELRRNGVGMVLVRDREVRVPDDYLPEGELAHA